MDDPLKLQRVVGGVVFPHPVIITGGSFKTFQEMEASIPTDTIPEGGSFTTLSLSGNGGLDYHAEYRDGVLILTLNSLGLPNPGMAYLESCAPALIKLYADAGKPLIINISGNGVDDTIALLKRALACGFRIITVNGACPNKPGQPMICWDKDAIDELFARLEHEIGSTDATIWWKVSLGMPLELLDHNLNWVIQSSVVTGIVTGNTVPNVRLLLPDGRPAINTTNGITAGGMAGPAVQALALDAIEHCAPRMPAGKIVVGCGGFGSAPSILRGIRAGATLIGMQSAWRESGFNPRFITSTLEELAELL